MTKKFWKYSLSKQIDCMQAKEPWVEVTGEIQEELRVAEEGELEMEELED